MSLIVVGFPGIGKTHLASHQNLSNHTIIEIDEYGYHFYPSGLINPKFPSNYISAIDKLKSQYEIIILPFTTATINALSKNMTDDFVLVYPVEESKDIYANRYKKYIDNIDKIKYYLDRFDGNIRYIETLDYYKYKLTPMQYLSDVINGIYNRYEYANNKGGIT